MYLPLTPVNINFKHFHLHSIFFRGVGVNSAAAFVYPRIVINVYMIIDRRRSPTVYAEALFNVLIVGGVCDCL